MTISLKSLRAIAEKATPGPWKVEPIAGHSSDVIHTAHPDYQQKPHGTYVGETGLAAGHKKQNYENDSAHIATFDPPTVQRLLAIAEAARAYVGLFHDKEGAGLGPLAKALEGIEP